MAEGHMAQAKLEHITASEANPSGTAPPAAQQVFQTSIHTRTHGIHTLTFIQWRTIAHAKQVFETNIRIVGGLLSAFYLTGGSDRLLLDKAAAVADRWATGAVGVGVVACWGSEAGQRTLRCNAGCMCCWARRPSWRAGANLRPRQLHSGDALGAVACVAAKVPDVKML